MPNSEHRMPNADGRTPLPHRLCVQLCCKKLYMIHDDREVALEDLQSAGYVNYWCRHTMTDDGPDGCWVTYERCAPGRACYEPMERNIAVGYGILGEH